MNHVCFDLFRCLFFFQDFKLVKNKPKLEDFAFLNFWPIFSPARHIKHLNRLEHTLANQFPSYVTLESH